MTTAQMENSLHTEVIRLKEHLFGFVNVHLLNTGLELGLFEELRNAGNVGLTVAELAQRKKLHEPYLSVWCRCAYGCGYLDMPETERFCLAPQMAAILADTQHPAYMGHMLRLFATYCSLDFLDHTEYLQTGAIFPVGAHGEGFTKLLAQNGITKGLKFLELVIPQVPHIAAMLHRGATILDVGCGGGTFMIALARAYPSCEFVGIDSDLNTVELADYEVASAGVSERIQVHHGEAEAIEFTNRFDVIFMNSVLREIRSHLQPRVLEHCRAALKPGGTMLISDFSLPEASHDLRDPAHRPALMDLCVEMTWGHQLQTQREQLTLLTQAGFVNVKSQPLGDNVYTLLCGERPR